MAQTENKSGRIIRSTLIRMYPGSFLYAIMFTFMFMIDSIIAGNALGEEALAAVAIGLPGYGAFLALMAAIVHGTGLRVTWAKGRADHPGFQRAFMGGLVFAGLAGIVFMAIILIFSAPIAKVFGGAKATEEIYQYSLLYLRCCAPMVFLSAISGALRENIGVLGYQTERAVLGIVNMGSNLIVSIVCVMLLPSELKMAGLGIGSSSAALIEFIAGIVIIRIRKVDVRLKPVMLRLGEMGETLKSGLPSSLDSVIDCGVQAVVNNIILTGVPDEPYILSVVAVVNNIKKTVKCAPQGIGYNSSPLFGIFFAQRDKAALKKTVLEAIKLGLVVTVAWSALCYVGLPLLSRGFGMELIPDIRDGVFWTVIFMPAYLVVYLLTAFYESTERFGSSLLMASIPDSLIYPVLLAILIHPMGKTGIWIAKGANPFLGLLVMIPFMMLLSHKNPAASDKILRLKPQIVTRPPMFQYEITGSDQTAVGLSESIQNFLLEQGKSRRIAYMAALSTEEIAVDMVSYIQDYNVNENSVTKLFAVRLFDDGDEVEILIRSMGRANNPLDFDPDTDKISKFGVKMIQKIAKKVTYTYVYKLNVVSIILTEK